MSKQHEKYYEDLKEAEKLMEKLLILCKGHTVRIASSALDMTRKKVEEEAIY